MDRFADNFLRESPFQARSAPPLTAKIDSGEKCGE